MDRRRYVPSPEGLEGRALLASSLFGSNLPNSNPSADVPTTFEVKEQRVERLPHFLELIRPGRFIPEATLKQLQADLLSVTTNLHAPGSAVLEGFNSRLRDVMPSTSLSVASAAGLSHSFGVALKAAGATPQQVTNLQNDMSALARNDANSPQPVFLATNDYTLVLETVLGIGRPIRKPEAPVLAVNNGTRVNPQAGITPKSQPTLVGTYDAQAQIQIVDPAGNVLGSTIVRREGPTQQNGQAVATGKYAVTFSRPLDDGLHTFHVRAVDAQGHASRLSPPFKLKVITRSVDHATSVNSGVPGGPLGLG
jgi:hypothetical protein